MDIHWIPFIVFNTQLTKSRINQVIKSRTFGKGIQIVPSNFTTVSALCLNSYDKNAV